MNSTLSRFIGLIFVLVIAYFLVKSVLWIATLGFVLVVGYQIFNNGVSKFVANTINLFKGK